MILVGRGLPFQMPNDILLRLLISFSSDTTGFASVHRLKTFFFARRPFGLVVIARRKQKILAAASF